MHTIEEVAPGPKEYNDGRGKTEQPAQRQRAVA
jgi:hypothetical protein